MKRTGKWISYNRETKEWTEHGVITCEATKDAWLNKVKWTNIETGETGFECMKDFRGWYFRKDIKNT